MTGAAIIAQLERQKEETVAMSVQTKDTRSALLHLERLRAYISRQEKRIRKYEEEALVEYKEAFLESQADFVAYK